MRKKLVLPIWLAFSWLVFMSTEARAAAPSWVQIRSPHFTVVTDSGEREGRQLLDQFERMRWVFQTMLPRGNVDPSVPLLVIATKNQKGMQALEPQAYLAKGQLNLAGLFLRTQDRNYILLRLDVEGEHPYSTVYHEYTHLQVGAAMAWLPLWLNEGLAEFFQNTDIHDKQVLLGQPSVDDILYLRQTALIPLTVLFQVDANSPYYHEEHKGSVFYAESWALTHYLETTDFDNHTHRLTTYVQLVSQHEDPVTAAEKAFGDLKHLQSVLESYIQNANYRYLVLSSASAPIDEASFQVTPLTPPQADAIRADFLANTGRTDDARKMLDAVLKADPNNIQAHETMGLVEYRAGHYDEAKKWYSEAAALDPHSSVARYHFAALALAQGITGPDVESNLQAAIQLNPRYAPAYDALAGLYGRRREKLDVAHMLNLQAVELDPENVQYRMNAAGILMEDRKYDDALNVLRGAAAVARTPLEAGAIQTMMRLVERNQVAGKLTGPS